LGKSTNTYDYVKKYFECNGFQLISDKYTSNKEKLKIKDNYGFVILLDLIFLHKLINQIL
jgi:hypothetical protein